MPEQAAVLCLVGKIEFKIARLFQQSVLEAQRCVGLVTEFCCCKHLAAAGCRPVLFGIEQFGCLQVKSLAVGAGAGFEAVFDAVHCPALLYCKFSLVFKYMSFQRTPFCSFSCCNSVEFPEVISWAHLGAWAGLPLCVLLPVTSPLADLVHSHCDGHQERQC